MWVTEETSAEETELEKLFWWSSEVFVYLLFDTKQFHSMDSVCVCVMCLRIQNIN